MSDIEKLKATLSCIKDCETIFGGEYYVIHSDYIIALEETLEKIIKEYYHLKYLGDKE